MKVFGKNGKVNVRKEASTSSIVVARIDKTNGVDYISTSNGWHKVKGGYVREDVGIVKSEHKYKDVVFDGYSFVDSPINTNASISFSKEIKDEYIPTIEKMNIPKGVRILATIMANKEGFYKGTRSYRTNNPGNIGNTDSGANATFKTLEDGIKAQINYITRVGKGLHSAHKFGMRTIKPYYSPEIAKNQKTYGIDPYLPGYKFYYKGQLGGFVKIYSTGARAGNGYLSQIISEFKRNGIIITEHTTISEILLY